MRRRDFIELVEGTASPSMPAPADSAPTARSLSWPIEKVLCSDAGMRLMNLDAHHVSCRRPPDRKRDTVHSDLGRQPGRSHRAEHVGTPLGRSDVSLIRYG